MEFQELLNQAKRRDADAMLRIVEMYRPLLIKYAKINNKFDEDLYEEFVCRLLICIRKFPCENL